MSWWYVSALYEWGDLRTDVLTIYRPEICGRSCVALWISAAEVFASLGTSADIFSYLRKSNPPAAIDRRDYQIHSNLTWDYLGQLTKIKLILTRIGHLRRFSLSLLISKIAQEQVLALSLQTNCDKRNLINRISVSSVADQSKKAIWPKKQSESAFTQIQRWNQFITLI